MSLLVPIFGMALAQAGFMFYATFNAGGINLMARRCIYGNAGNRACITDERTHNTEMRSYHNPLFVVTGGLEYCRYAKYSPKP